MDSSMNRRPVRPSGMVDPSLLDLRTLGVNGCGSWAAMDPTSKVVTVTGWLISDGAPHDPASINAAIAVLDNACVAITPPVGSDVAITCDAWSALTHAEKLGRVRTFFGANYGPWVTDRDVASSVTAIDTECLHGVLDSTAAAAAAALALANTRVEVTVTHALPLPADTTATLDGMPMSPLALPRPALFFGNHADLPMGFELHGLAPGNHTLQITGTGLVSVQQIVPVDVGTARAVTVAVAPQLASYRAVVALPPGVNPATVVVAGIPGIARATDGSWVATNVVPGTYDVTATAPGLDQQHHSEVLGPGASVAAGFALNYLPASLTVTTNAPGATVLLDGRPMDGLVASGITPGDHVVAITAPGFAPAQQTVTLTGGQAGSVTFTLTPVPVVAVAPVVTAPIVVTTTTAPKSSFGWWAAAIAAVIGGATLAVKRQKETEKQTAARQNPDRAKNTFKVGDLVCYKRKFLQSTQWFTNVPINGRVEEINEAMQMPKVLWNDRDDAILVHPGNLVLWKNKHMDHS